MLVEEPLADHFRGFAAVVERDGGTTYPAICRAIADDDDVLSILDRAPLPQRRPLLLLAAVHFLLLSGTDHPLAAYYDTVATVRGAARPTPRPAATSPPRSPTSAACTGPRSSGWSPPARPRPTRSGAAPACSPGSASSQSQYEWREPLALLDLGTSAGLNLLFDDYGYTYRAAEGGAVLTAGAADSAVALECSVRDDLTHLPELRLPVMAGRVGLDLSPVNPFSDEEARWLLACQWPDNLARFGRLRAALANVRAAAHPPRLERGDMLVDLPEVAATIAGDGPLVVFHSWVAAYLSERQQRILVDQVAALGRGGPCTTSTASRPSRLLACPRPRPRCRGRGRIWPPRWSTSAPARVRPCAWPTPIRTGTGSAGGYGPNPQIAC